LSKIVKENDQMDNVEKKYKLLTLKEAAEYLRMHKGSLYRLLENGKTDIPAIKLGGKWLFNLESLNKYLSEKEMQASNKGN
jgi:excisionase family DNA binding protein